MLSTTLKFIPFGASLVLAQLASEQLESRQDFIYGNDSPLAQGCFSSPGGGITNMGSDGYQSSGNCGGDCSAQGKPVFAVQGLYCYCSNLLPALSDQVSESLCNSYCPGIDTENCGGHGVYNVYVDSLSYNTFPARVSSGGNSDDDTSSSSSSSTTSTTSSSTSSSSSTTPHTTHRPRPPPTHAPVPHKHHNNPPPHSTKVLTSTQQYTITQSISTSAVPNSGAEQTTTPSESSSSSSSTGKTIGIAVGVIGGVLAFAGLVAGMLFYLRRRRRMKNAENGHRRADSLNAYDAAIARSPTNTATTSTTLAGKMSSPHPPSIAINDSRLDPWVMRETRRESGASFLADNQDYSRRILKVTNPDSS